MRTANVRTIALWTLVAQVGAAGRSVLALARGEDASAAWMVAAAPGSYAIGYRCSAKFIAHKVLRVDATRATAAERLDNGIDFRPTDRRVSLGHHVAAIAGAGPLVARPGPPVLAAQMASRTHRRVDVRPPCRTECGRNARKRTPGRDSAAAEGCSGGGFTGSTYRYADEVFRCRDTSA